jgi:hypothetical protein
VQPQSLSRRYARHRRHPRSHTRPRRLRPCHASSTLSVSTSDVASLVHRPALAPSHRCTIPWPFTETRATSTRWLPDGLPVFSSPSIASSPRLCPLRRSPPYPAPSVESSPIQIGGMLWSTRLYRPTTPGTRCHALLAPTWSRGSGSSSRS